MSSLGVLEMSIRDIITLIRALVLIRKRYLGSIIKQRNKFT